MAEVLLDGAGSQLVWLRGAAALRGPDVESAAEGGLAAVPAAWRERRRERDGDGFHITFLTKADLQTLALRLAEGRPWPEGAEPPEEPASHASVARAVGRVVAALPGPLEWVDAGAGRASEEGAEAFFRVALWPAGAEAREALGLPPRDFHVTLGFRGRDVHGRSKGLTSLTSGVVGAAAVAELAAAAQRLLDAGAGRGRLAEGVEQLAKAALEGAEAHADAPGEAAALRVLCVLCGRLKRPRDVLAYSGRLLALEDGSELGWRSRAIALVALRRDAEALQALGRLRPLVSQQPPGKERGALERWMRGAAERCGRAAASAAAAAEPGESGEAGSLFPGSEDRATEAGDLDFEECFLAKGEQKFPSTAHLKNLGAATRDDKLCDAVRQRSFCSGARRVSVEEKIDGANLGISLDSRYQWRMQARSKMVNWNTDPQFAGLEQWLTEHQGALCELLERNNDVLFGEWCAYRHTVKYSRLPGYFLAFDIFDRRAGRFLSRASFHTRLQRASGPKVPAVPTICAPRTFAAAAEVEELLQRRSAFADGFLEGVYLRIDEDAVPGRESYLEDRCKLVRSEFQQAIEAEGSWRGRGKNDLDLELALTYAEHCFPCAAPEAGAAGPFEPPARQAVPGAGEKYPSTPHLPFSPGVHPDDVRLADCADLLRGEVVVTEKVDGGNCCIKGGQVYARTHSKPATHESFSAVKQLATGFGDLGDLELYGENVQAVHSIEYDNLASFFYVFAARRGGEWLPWDEVAGLAEGLGLPTVPLVFRGHVESPERLQECLEAWAREPSAVGRSVTPEGFVVRRASGYASGAFGAHVAKYVRADHLQTCDAWRRRWRKAQLGPALPPRPPRSLGPLDPLRARLANPRARHRVDVEGLGEVELPRNFSLFLADVAVSSTPTRREHVQAMAGMDIALVVTLTEETPLPPAWFAETGVENLFVPIPNYHPPTLPQMDAVVEAVSAAAAAGQKVMVHCGGGKGRAGAVAACLALRFGTQGVREALRREAADGCVHPSPMQSDEVLQHLREQRPGSVETERQERFIREFAAALWRRAAEAPKAPPLLRAASSARSEHEEGELLGARLFDGAAAAEAEEEGAHRDGRGGRGAARAKREDREAQRRLKGTQRRSPKYVLMCGLAASGKSTFCEALEASGEWTRVSQDDLGRKRCEELALRTAPLVRQGKARIVVDRCNLTRRERAEWLDVVGKPPASEVVCVFFDADVEECKQRAAARLGHPTIRVGGGARIIAEQAKQLERPAVGEGFGAVEVVASFADAAALLRRYGAKAEDDAGAPGARPAGAAAADDALAQAEDVACAPGEDAAGADVCQVAAQEDACALPAAFEAWLRSALPQEVGSSEAEAIWPAVEVILAGASSDPEALGSASGVLRDSGAERGAAELEARWRAAGGAICLPSPKHG